MSEYYRDKTGKLDEVMEEVKENYFPELEIAKFLYTFRTKIKHDDEGYVVAGEARKLSVRERDLYNYDFEICIYHPTWSKYTKKQRKRLCWHELYHCRVRFELDDMGDETNEPIKDKENRISIRLQKHDIVLKTFFDELVEFGPTKDEVATIFKIYKYALRSDKLLRSHGKRVIKRRKK